MAVDPSVMGNLYQMMYQMNKMYPLGANQQAPVNMANYNTGNRGGAPVNTQYQPPQEMVPHGNSQTVSQAPQLSVAKGNNKVMNQQARWGQIPVDNLPLQPTGQLIPPQAFNQAAVRRPNPQGQGPTPDAQQNYLQQYLQALRQFGQQGSVQQPGHVNNFMQQALAQGYDPNTIAQFIAGQSGLNR